MKAYRGFSPKERSDARAWLEKEIAEGRRAKPTHCEACGQTHGIIEAHTEDYSEPYGKNIGEYSLCYRCHMMLHSRFSHPDDWLLYRAAVLRGIRYRPMVERYYPQVALYFNPITRLALHYEQFDRQPPNLFTILIR